MLFRNLLLVVFFIGMALSIPVKDKKSKEVTSTVSLVALETLPTSKDDEEKEDDVEVIKFEHYIDAAEETGAVEEKEEETVEVINKEDENKEEKEEEKEEKKEEKKESKSSKDEQEDDFKKNLPESDEEAPTVVAPFIPENDAILTEFEDTCTKDHIILGNHVTTGVCDDLYDACTTKELLSIIVYFYSRDAPVSIEYTINEGMNKESISEQCASVLINSKIFFKETVVIPPVDETPDVEKITHILQDLPTQAPNNGKDDENPTAIGDVYAEYSEDDIEDDDN